MIEERLVINPADIPKLVAFGSGTYIIYQILPKKIWVVTDPEGKEHELSPYWAGYAPWGGENGATAQLKEIKGFSLWHFALASLGSYMLIEHGRYLFGLAAKLTGGMLMP